MAHQLINHHQLRSGYLTERTGKSPFFSSVNHHVYHLFLWAIFQIATLNNQRVYLIYDMVI
jgi:hypothetical protein